MGKFLWILGAASLGVAAYVILNDRSASMQAADGLDEFSGRADMWGAKQRVTGTGGVLGGKLEQGFGKLTGDRKTQGEGVLDEAAGLSRAAPARDAGAAAIQEPRGPVVIADTQDNPGGGGHGDTTGLLAELIRQGARGAVVCLINDAESAACCHGAGQGGMVRLSLGGKSDGASLAVEAVVLRLTDGRFTLTGPMGGGNPANLGPMALIQVEPGVRVVVASRKMQALDQAILRHVGVEPADCRIIALKSSVHFRADFGPLASRVIVAAAPGPVAADPASLSFGHLRPGLRTRLGQ